jgi:hypothetical protein
MYSHGYNWREEPKGTSLSSVLLLLVFVSAAAFMVGMAWLKPWAEEGAPEAAVAQETPAAEAPPAVEAPAP